MVERRTLLAREPFEVDQNAEIVSIVSNALGASRLGGASYWADSRLHRRRRHPDRAARPVAARARTRSRSGSASRTRQPSPGRCSPPRGVLRVTAFVNPALDPARVPAADGAEATAFHRALPGYAPTPVRELPELAAELGVAAVLVKDESDRFGLPAFKVLGASWAIERTLRTEPGIHTLVAASAGNHGRAVAHVAATTRARVPGLPARALGAREARGDRGRRRRGRRRRRHLRGGGRRRAHGGRRARRRRDRRRRRLPAGLAG